jgi:hypothetical protein
VRITNRGPFAASDVKVSVSPPSGVTLSATPVGACANVGTALECSFGGVLANQQADLLVTLSAGAAAPSGTLSVSVTGHEPDPSTGNNSVTATVTSTQSGGSSGGGGGGGADGILAPLALLTMLLLRLRRRRL